MTAEQQARDMLERMGVDGAQSFSAGDLVELANLIADRADAERWRKALAAYESGVEMGRNGRTGETLGYISMFLAAIRERDEARAQQVAARSIAAIPQGTSSSNSPNPMTASAPPDDVAM